MDKNVLKISFFGEFFWTLSTSDDNWLVSQHDTGGAEAKPLVRSANTVLRQVRGCRGKALASMYQQTLFGVRVRLGLRWVRFEMG